MTSHRVFGRFGIAPVDRTGLAPTISSKVSQSLIDPGRCQMLSEQGGEGVLSPLVDDSLHAVLGGASANKCEAN